MSALRPIAVATGATTHHGTLLRELDEFEGEAEKKSDDSCRAVSGKEYLLPFIRSLSGSLISHGPFQVRCS